MCMWFGIFFCVGSSFRSFFIGICHNPVAWSCHPLMTGCCVLISFVLLPSNMFTLAGVNTITCLPQQICWYLTVHCVGVLGQCLLCWLVPWLDIANVLLLLPMLLVQRVCGRSLLMAVLFWWRDRLVFNSLRLPLSLLPCLVLILLAFSFWWLVVPFPFSLCCMLLLCC